jgi:hypothetical protein
MLKTLGIPVLVVILILVVVLIFTSIGAAILAATGWLLTLITSLTLPQAVLVAGAIGLTIAYLSQRELDMGVLESVLMVLIITPLVSLSFMGIAWGLDRLSSLDFWQATLLVTAVGLMVLYGFAQRVVDLSLGKKDEEEEEWDDEEEWDEEEEWGDEEEWDDEEWDDEEWDDEEVVLPPLSRRRAWSNPDSEIPAVGRNEPCPCGSGKKYKYCHGRKSR